MSKESDDLLAGERLEFHLDEAKQVILFPDSAINVPKLPKDNNF